MKRPRVVIADDHRIFGEGLRRLLEPEFEVVDLVEDGAILVRRASALAADVIVLDIGMPGLNGLQALRRLRREGVGARVVVLTMHDDADYAAEAIREGAAGYVLKSADPKELLRALQEALAGNVYLPPALARDVLQLIAQGSKPTAKGQAELTPRQIEVLERLAAGKIAKEIADELGLSQRTVEYHKYKMMSDLGIETTAELIHFAVREGYAGP